jgi:hypothetical protein
MAVVVCLGWATVPGTNPLKADQAPQTVEVLVAKKDITLGTLIAKPEEHFTIT